MATRTARLSKLRPTTREVGERLDRAKLAESAAIGPMPLFCHLAQNPAKLPTVRHAVTSTLREALHSPSLAWLLLFNNSLHSGRAECLFAPPPGKNQREAREIHEAGRGFSRGSGLGGSPTSSLFFMETQVAADQILLKNLDASNIE